MDGWMDGWMDGLMNGWMDGNWINRRMNSWGKNITIPNSHKG